MASVLRRTARAGDVAPYARPGPPGLRQLDDRCKALHKLFWSGRSSRIEPRSCLRRPRSRYPCQRSYGSRYRPRQSPAMRWRDRPCAPPSGTPWTAAFLARGAPEPKVEATRPASGETPRWRSVPQLLPPKKSSKLDPPREPEPPVERVCEPNTLPPYISEPMPEPKVP